MEKDIERLQQIIDESNNITFFGGAGVSTESNIPDFRSTDGIYNQKYRYPPEIFLSHDFFVNYTEEFYDFYKDKMLYLDAQPNKAHLWLAKLERRRKLSAVVTQNIDGLHQKAGSNRVFELHGTVHRNYCQKCYKLYDAKYVKDSVGIPRCECGGILKPDVVLYDEGLDNYIFTSAMRSVEAADTLIIAGTSLTVYPAASLVDHFNGKYLVLINRDSTPRDSEADLVIHGSVGEILDKINI